MAEEFISHYRVLEKLGEGGMGEVFLAEDTMLERRVALKFLPPELNEEPVARRRFLLEAKAAAGLDHPFIAQIHEIGEVEGRSYIVMEYLSGVTLKERLARGPLPLIDVLQAGAEVAEALHAAHAAGIIHRDLKPSNIMLTGSGHVKVMDFGLAKVVTLDSSLGQDASLTGLTGTGIRLGTVPYMSPEQLTGQELDVRTDLFSFGVVLYEMLTGRHPFRREDAFATAGAILKEPPPPLTGHSQGGGSELLAHCLKRTLAKRREERYQSALEIRTDLLDMAASVQAGSASDASGGVTSGWRRLALIAVAALVLGGLLGWILRPNGGAAPAAPLRLEVSLPAGERLAHYYRGGIDLSPDGRRIALVTGRVANPYLFPESTRIQTRLLDQWHLRPVVGTADAIQPVFSPDGEVLAFTQWDREQNEWLLRTVRLDGGEPRTVCRCDARWGVTWLTGDTLVFGSQHGGLYRVGTGGGEPELLAGSLPVAGAPGFRLPHAAPGGEVVFFTAPLDAGALSPTARIMALKPGDGTLTDLGEGWDGRYVAPGFLVFGRAGQVWARPFDLGRLEATGPETVLVDGVAHALFTVNPTLRTGALQLAFSSTGRLAYGPGSVFPEIRGPVAWVDRQGREELLDIEPRNYFTARLSGSGESVLLTTIYPPQEVWLYDLARRALRRQTFEGNSVYAIWGPTDGRFTFAAGETAKSRVWVRPADAGPSPSALLVAPSEGELRPSSWSPDGRRLAVVRADPGRRYDVYLVDAEGRASPFLATSYSEQYPEFSPDGRWLVYSSDESGQQEVYVRPYPGPGLPLPVSTGGGIEPAWSRDGREIFYRRGGTFFSVAFQERQGGARVGVPTLLFEGDYGSAFAVRSWDVGADGRLLLLKRPEAEVLEAAIDEFFPAGIRVVDGWSRELRPDLP